MFDIFFIDAEHYSRAVNAFCHKKHLNFSIKYFSNSVTGKISLLLLEKKQLECFDGNKISWCTNSTEKENKLNSAFCISL